jgi:hypothetical protein
MMLLLLLVILFQAWILNDVCQRSMHTGYLIALSDARKRIYDRLDSDSRCQFNRWADYAITWEFKGAARDA